MKLANTISANRTRRVAIISSYAGSIGNFRGPLIREMVNRGHAVLVFAPDYDTINRDAVVSLGAVPVDYSLSRATVNPFTDFMDTLSLWWQLRGLKLDFTLAYFIKPVVYGTLAARLASVPNRFAMIEGAGYVFSDYAESSVRRSVLRAIVVWLYKLSLHQVERVFVLNPDDKALFLQKRMVAAEKIQLLDGIGLDLDHYRPTPVQTNPVVFLFIGRFLREKGIQDYVTAARQVKKVYPAARFLMLGSIDSNPGSFTQKEVDAWVGEGAVEYPGYVPDVRPWIGQASVFVLPSYYREGMPRSTQEAMAMGRPVITTDVPGCRQTVKEGVNGFLVPARDPVALAAAILKFVEQPEIIVSMGLESRRMAERRFDVHKINAVIMKTMGLDEARN